MLYNLFRYPFISHSIQMLFRVWLSSSVVLCDDYIVTSFIIAAFLVWPLLVVILQLYAIQCKQVYCK
jgi:cytochrome c oxidase subunit IV